MRSFPNARADGKPSGALLTLALIQAAAGCPERPPGQPCVESDDCLANEVCISAVCRQVCNSSRDCEAEYDCTGGACMPRRTLHDAGAAPQDARQQDTQAQDVGLQDRASGDSAGDASAVDRAWRDSRGVDQPIADRQASEGVPVDAPGPDLAATVPDQTRADAAVRDLQGVDALVPGWHQPSHRCRVRIDIDNSDLTQPLDDFPLLVQVPRALACEGSSIDIGEARLVADDGAPLFHDEEQAPQTEPHTLWVRVPVVAAPPAASAIWLYFAAQGTVDPVDSSQVWPEPFRGVWHLDDSLEATWFTAKDATPYGNHADPEGMMGPSNRAQGRCGFALYFDGSNDHLLIGDPPEGSLDFGPEDSFTYSAWVFTTAPAGFYDMPWHKGGSSTSVAGYDLELGSDRWGVGLSDGSAAGYVLLSFGDAADYLGRWVHLAVTVDRSALRAQVFVDGQVTAMQAIASGFDLRTSTAASIGASNLGTYAFHGYIDEVRVEAVARPAVWIAAQHRSMSGEMVALGAVEMRP